MGFDASHRQCRFNEFGKTAFQPLIIQKNVDNASPFLMQALVTGKKIAAMTLLVRNAGESAASPFLIYQFSTVHVSALQESGGAGGADTVTESVSFVFGAYDLRYRATYLNGKLSTAVTESEWSVLTNSVPRGPH
jgi:type VI protein secretion system component Hcp